MSPSRWNQARLASTALALALCSAAAFAAERHEILYQGERLTIVDRDGLAIWQGDIVLGQTAELLESTRIADLLGADSPPLAKGTGLGTATGRWPRGSSGLFELPYVIESDPDNGVPPAIVAFNQQLAGFFRAVPRTTEADYVAFNFDPNDTVGPCFSPPGRQGGRQSIGGARNCNVGRLLHELGHAMGLHHEQERSDTRRWVTIDIDAVDPSLAYNYDPNINTRDLGSYDYGSIMHYGPTGFSKTGSMVMESIPPGIRLGQRDGYSKGDLDALHRLYGVFDAAIVVETFPSGLTVIVDGTSTVTPATFNWPLGSTHTLDVPAGAQTLAGTVHAFGRWSSDAAGTLATRQVITVAPGNGTLTQPAAFPAVSVYTANFVRMKAVRFATSGNRTGVGGTLAVDPQPVSVAGVSGAYYYDRQPFTLTPTPNPGSTFGRWRGAYSFYTFSSTNYTPQMRGPLFFADTPATYDFTAYFVDFPYTTVKARAQDGDVMGLSATVTRASGSSASNRLPYNTADTTTPWTAGESGTVTFPASASPFVTSIRYVFASANGSSQSTSTLTHPASGQASQTIVATYNKQYEPFKQVVPSCAASITLGTNADGWVDHGATMPVSLAANAGWTLAQWRGSLSGTGNSRSLTVTDVPDLTAVMNVVPTPLAITALSPASTPAGRPLTLEIVGTGFVQASRVFVGGVSKTPSSITAERIVVPLAAGDYPATGKVMVTVQNRTSAPTCSLNASAVFETYAADSQPLNYTSLWWNRAESGWGLNLNHQGNILFATLFTYDAARAPLWLLMSSGNLQSDGVTFTGDLYRTTGPAFNANPFTPIGPANVTKVGTMSVSFRDVNSAVLTYSVNGVAVTKSIERQVFGSRAASCQPTTSSRATLANYQDLWWNPSESGWGVNVTHQDNTLFATLFTYDLTGRGLWLVMSQGARQADGSFLGDLFETTGSAFNAQPFVPLTPANLTKVGTMRFNFSDGNNGTLAYSYNGVPVTKSITRQTFSSPVPLCN